QACYKAISYAFYNLLFILFLNGSKVSSTQCSIFNSSSFNILFTGFTTTQSYYISSTFYQNSSSFYSSITLFQAQSVKYYCNSEISQGLSIKIPSSNFQTLGIFILNLNFVQIFKSINFVIVISYKEQYLQKLPFIKFKILSKSIFQNIGILAQ
ncbi:hypothetical protein IMG5_145090, partial [Ichthyophthirius multifiliis]